MTLKIHKKSLILYVLVLVASVVFSSFYGGPVSYAWLFAILFIIPVAILYLAINYRFISIYQEIEVHRLTKGEDHRYRAFIENEGILPVHDLCLGIYTDRCNIYEIPDQKKISLEAKEKIELSSGINCRFAGSYEVGIETISFTDPFSIFTVTFDIPYSFRAIVSPRITDVADKVLDLENLVNSTGLKSTNIMDDAPSNDMRPYQRGDSYSSINWKVSARLSELMVRVPDPMEKRTVSILMKAANVPEKDQDTRFLEKRDRFLEFAVSAAWHFGQQGVPIKLVYPAGKVKESIVDSYDSFLEFYNIVADGILYSSEADEIDMNRRFENIRGIENGTDTWIIIREDYDKPEDFCTICG